MKKTIAALLCSLLWPVFLQADPSLKTGAQRMDNILPLLKDKKVGLVVNQTSVVGNKGAHLLDALLDKGVQVVRIFAPEHGFRGDRDAGAHVTDGRDPTTGLPIVSLYGKGRKPSARQMKDLDVMVFDIQDVGTRFFTYISTLHYVMEACAEQDKMLLVLDRPNPNDFVDGPVLEKGFESFVGLHPIPVLHGLTVGELALMINGQGWLRNLSPGSCRLHVVPVLGWKHGDLYDLPVRPSPNLPTNKAVRLYPSLCFFEATRVSVGRGTHFPFQVIGFPSQEYGRFCFTPVAMPGFDSNPMHRDQPCYGDDLREIPFEGGLTLRFFLDFYKRSGCSSQFISRPEWLDLLSGNSRLRKQIMSGATEKDIRESWQPSLEAYRKVRAKYLLYPDYR